MFVYKLVFLNVSFLSLAQYIVDVNYEMRHSISSRDGLMICIYCFFEIRELLYVYAHFDWKVMPYK